MKRAAALILALALCFSLCACGADKEISIYDLQKAMLSADGELPEMLTASSSDSDGEKKFAYLSDMDYSEVEGYFLAYSADGTAYEIAVICLKDGDDTDLAKASLQSHLDGRISLYKTYEPTQASRAEDALIISRGSCVALIMCDNTDAVKSAFEEFLK
ncbi:MAG: DUF4358 domain-containing protein [Bacillota bacterium]|nr:DUF4358 domain-containing protein [Bacillota bacterium]